MRTVLQLISVVALLSTILPAILFLAGNVEIDQVKWLMLLATTAWFIFTPIWMGRIRTIEEAPK